MNGYNIPHSDKYEPFYKIDNVGFSKKLVRDNFMDDYVKQMKFKKSPALYETGSDWTKNKNGKFFAGKKVTMSESIFVNAKLRPRPGPVSYENKNTMIEKVKKKSKAIEKEIKMCGFIE